MKLNHSKKILIVTVIVFLVVIVANLIFSDLLFNKVIDVNNKIRQVSISAEEREHDLKLKDSVVNSEEARGELENFFVEAGDAKTADFINYLEDLAKQNNLKYDIKSVGYDAISELSSSESVYFIKFKFNVTGSWSNVFSFLRIIENLPKVVSISGISLDVNPSFDPKSKTKTWSADIDFSVVKLKN